MFVSYVITLLYIQDEQCCASCKRWNIKCVISAAILFPREFGVCWRRYSVLDWGSGAKGTVIVVYVVRYEKQTTARWRHSDPSAARLSGGFILLSGDRERSDISSRVLESVALVSVSRMKPWRKRKSARENKIILLWKRSFLESYTLLRYIHNFKASLRKIV